jgi:hypothetical protein
MNIDMKIYEPGQETAMIFTLEKMKMSYKRIEKRRKIVAIRIEYDDPVDLVYFGMTLVGDMTGIFKSALTI